MKILHISSDFLHTPVYINLCKELDSIGAEQRVFVGPDKVETRSPDFMDKLDVEYLFSEHPAHYLRYFYHYKLRLMYRSLVKEDGLEGVDVIHAHTLFSDGGVAYKAFKKYGIPYVVSVRNTDINAFMRVGVYAWGTGRKILKNASKICFISPSAYKTFSNHLMVRDIMDELGDKIVIQPNGIDDFWLKNIQLNNTAASHSICYVGQLTNNKNVLALIDAVLLLKDEFPDIKLTIIGKDGEQEEEVKKIASRENCIIYKGPIYDKASLLKEFREHKIFAMISIYETFGLVYVEALSQGLKLLFTKGQGVDGYFENVGLPVEATNKKDIYQALKTLLKEGDSFSGAKNVDFNSFRWRNIANIYYNIYQKLI